MSETPNRVQQLEQALALSRELYRDEQLKNERFQRTWADKEAKLLQRIEWLEAQIVSDVARASRAKKPRHPHRPHTDKNAPVMAEVQALTRHSTGGLVYDVNEKYAVPVHAVDALVAQGYVVATGRVFTKHDMKAKRFGDDLSPGTPDPAAMHADLPRG